MPTTTASQRCAWCGWTGPRAACTSSIDLNVSVALAGDLADTHLTGDNAKVLPTDTQKNTVYAFARDGVGSAEAFGLRLARHFVDSQPTIDVARVSIEEYRLATPRAALVRPYGRGRPDRDRDLRRRNAWVVSGVSDLVLLNSTDSEFHGFLVDQYTTLAPTADRILATAVNATWRHASTRTATGTTSMVAARDALVGAFVGTYSLSLQQTLHAMGQAVLDRLPDVAEVRLSLPNRHHFLVDLAPFGLDNPGEVYYPADRPYGLIEGSVLREDAPPPGLAWSMSAA